MLINQSKEHQLESILKAHLFISEFMQPWFFFAFMESKNLTKQQRIYAAGSELMVENKITEIIQVGQDLNEYSQSLPAETYAAMIKPLLHDWYLKRGKYKKRRIDVDSYAENVIQFVNRGLLND